jgi:chromosome segregation ATPase
MLTIAFLLPMGVRGEGLLPGGQVSEGAKKSSSKDVAEVQAEAAEKAREIEAQKPAAGSVEEALAKIQDQLKEIQDTLDDMESRQKRVENEIRRLR